MMPDETDIGGCQQQLWLDVSMSFLCKHRLDTSAACVAHCLCACLSRAAALLVSGVVLMRAGDATGGKQRLHKALKLAHAGLQNHQLVTQVRLCTYVCDAACLCVCTCVFLRGGCRGGRCGL